VSGCSSARIGVLDSGIGGLSVLREIHRLLPSYPTLYVADQYHLPYGPRPHDQIHCYVDAVTRFLHEQGASVVVLACHAASAASLQRLRQSYPEHAFVGIEPAVKPAAQATRSGVVGVLTTQATADGELYRSVVSRFAGDVRVLTQVAPELVTLAEAADVTEVEALDIVRGCVRPLLDAGADEIVLACTHFPFLAPWVRQVAGADVALVDPGPAVARQVQRVLQASDDASTERISDHRYYTTGDADAFSDSLKRLLGIDGDVRALRWDERYLPNGEAALMTATGG
jgi:glutamate racemase